ncbi:hypothetical protein ONE63_003028 [Megalurothrips usitatus]|uniref:Uncharacterized protein n=1 Tax=Megalurothrips usitatus TaxID=439358 RepID=A0AAV7XA03_9NEOP|nr:hypothetical protein ONE63_003028 [Megalurothrips usitatus]
MVHTGSGSIEDVKALLARCLLQLQLPRDRPVSGERSCDACPVLAAYRPALAHVLNATFLMVKALFDRRNVEDIPAAKHLGEYESLGAACKAAVWAIKAQVKLTCYLGLSPDAAAAAGLPPSSLLLDATLSASRARDMHPGEGQWKALYGDLLPDDNPRKLTLLRNAVRARRTPFTLTCLSRYLHKLGDNEAFDLCADALVLWPRSVHANVSYVVMFLSAEGCPGKLSRELAEQCLQRLQRLAPHCVFARGLALELRLRRAEDAVRPEAAAGGGNGDAPESTTAATPGQRPVRQKAFEPTDPEAANKAVELYCGSGDGPWSMVRHLRRGSVTLDPCNCVCCGECAYRTFREHGTLLVRDRPAACYSE